MEPIIAPVPRDVLKSELTDERLLRSTNKADNLVYLFRADEAPNLMREVGRLREIAFRTSGGGTGLDCDVDEFDLGDHAYTQLIVWDPEQEVIAGGYRYILGEDCAFNASGQPHLATSHMFHFSDEFLGDYLPHTIELGRSFVSRDYISKASGRKGIFALDNLWDGLGALAVENPGYRYFFGKFTMYPSFDRLSRDLILYFLRKHFGGSEHLIAPFRPLPLETPVEQLAPVFTADDFKSDYRNLNREVRLRGVNIPPLVNAYMGLSPTMKFFGTAINDEFGDVEESGILIDFEDILPEKRERHIESYLPKQQ
ncbi:MAG: GNAT family N-acetyltransferase [Bacteroidaceae bacterium]|nr:GNAT family N-acetyltransferase [Bacteroidaceae bacterium]